MKVKVLVTVKVDIPKDAPQLAADMAVAKIQSAMRHWETTVRLAKQENLVKFVSAEVRS